jgi:GNAT superfamily N-acetyltransferase
MTYAIRLAREGELEALQRIEEVAGELYASAGLPSDLPGLALDALRESQREGLIWVTADADDAPVGFAMCWRRPSALHLRELDVLPEHGRRGLGGRLLEHVALEAASRELPRVTLTTFADVPWNAPYYERHGFARLPPGAIPGWLAELRREEARAGLDRWPRVAMERPVTRAR